MKAIIVHFHEKMTKNENKRSHICSFAQGSEIKKYAFRNFHFIFLISAASLVYRWGLENSAKLVGEKFIDRLAERLEKFQYRENNKNETDNNHMTDINMFYRLVASLPHLQYHQQDQSA